MSKINDFLSLLKAEENKGIYVWGGDGENLSAMSDPVAWIKKHETGTANANRAIKLLRKRQSAGVSPIRAFDCSGFVYAMLKELGIQKTDLNSRGLYGICTPIPKSEIRAGDLAFVWQDKDGDGFDVSEIYHVGVVLDKDTIIECKGRDYGVVVSKATLQWRTFGRLKAFADLPVGEPTQPTQPSDPSVYWRELKVTSPLMRGADVLWVQTTLVALDYSVGKSGLDGIYGKDTAQAVKDFQGDCNTAATGIVNKDTWARLLASIAEDITDVAYYGDADGDGEITAADAAKILRSIVHLEGALPLAAGDANNDGEVTAADAAYVLRCAVRLAKPKEIKNKE